MSSNLEGLDERLSPQVKLKASTKTLAIVLLVLGGLACVRALVAPLIALVIEAIASTQVENRELKQLSRQLQGVLHPWSLLSLSVSFLLGLVLFIGGIGTLVRRRWAATLLWIGTGLMIPLTVVQTVMGMYIQWVGKDEFMKQFEDQLQSEGASVEVTDLVGTFGEIGFVVQFVLAITFGLFFLALYAFAFMHLGKPETRAQLDPIRESARGRR